MQKQKETQLDAASYKTESQIWVETLRNPALSDCYSEMFCFNCYF